MSKSYWKNQIKFLFTLLSILSVIWLGFIIWNNLPKLMKSFSDINLLSFLFICTFSLVSSYVSFEAFRCIFHITHPNTYSRKQLAHFYFTSQMMKHLPGRIWGIAYQANQGTVASTMQWIGINSIHMLINTAVALWIAIAILLFTISPYIASIFIFIGFPIFYIILSPKIFEKIRMWAKNKNYDKLFKLFNSIYEISSKNIRSKNVAFIYILTGWILYLISWAGYSLVWPSLSILDAIALCGIYTIAWFVGYVSFISPSGIGIRELVFIFLANDFPIEIITSILLFARCLLLLNDLTLGLIFLKNGTTHDTKK